MVICGQQIAYRVMIMIIDIIPHDLETIYEFTAYILI